MVCDKGVPTEYRQTDRQANIVVRGLKPPTLGEA